MMKELIALTTAMVVTAATLEAKASEQEFEADVMPVTAVMHELGYVHWDAAVRRLLSDADICRLAGYNAIVYDPHTQQDYCARMEVVHGRYELKTEIRL